MHKTAAPGECTQSVCLAHMQQHSAFPDP